MMHGCLFSNQHLRKLIITTDISLFMKCTLISSNKHLVNVYLCGRGIVGSGPT